MARFPDLTEADSQELLRIVEHALANDVKAYMVLAVMGPWQLIATDGHGRLDDVPTDEGFYEQLAAAGYCFLSGDNGHQLRLTPLAYAYARYRRRSRAGRWLDDAWHWLNADRPLWLRSTYGCLTFLVAAFTTGVGFVVGLWLAHVLGVPLT